MFASHRYPDEPVREAAIARWMLLGRCLLGAALAFLEHHPNADDGYYFSFMPVYRHYPEGDTQDTD